ncbi:MAG: Rrf2 family transcriptional regulator [Acidobacteriota bacterium]
MKISTLEDQCLRCLARIAAGDGRVTIGRIAESEGLSVENTAKILGRLREAGLIESHRGKDGGYTLVRPAEEISVSDVLTAIGGELFESERCTGSAAVDPCIHESCCGIRPIWATLGDLMHALLASISLADLVGDRERLERRLAAARQAMLAAGDAADAGLRLPAAPPRAGR